MPGGDLPPGILDALRTALQYTTALTALGGAVGWLYRQWEKERIRRAEAVNDLKESDQEWRSEQLQFFDERARSEIKRLEHERDEARAECSALRADREAAIRLEGRLREEWRVCRHEAVNAQQLVRSLIAKPAPPGTPVPVFDELPDPRHWPDTPETPKGQT